MKTLRLVQRGQPPEARPVTRPNQTHQQLLANHHLVLGHILKEATGIASAAANIAHAVHECLEQGGTVNVTSQANYLLGAYGRLFKDLGALEHVQLMGGFSRPPNDTGGRRRR